MKIEQKPSPNHSDRKTSVDILLMHDTGGTSLGGAVAWCLNKTSSVSYHYIVDADGNLVQLVSEDLRAWHAGHAQVPGEVGPSDVNSRSIGVALVGDGSKPYPQVQLMAAAALCSDIARRHGITRAGILRHRDVAIPPGRKGDPCDLFPWEEFVYVVAGAEP